MSIQLLPCKSERIVGCKYIKNGNIRIWNGKRLNCEHNRVTSNCKDCTGVSICIHNKRRTLCINCGGASLCKHNKPRNKCINCGGKSICIHNRIMSSCTECKGGNICEHNKRRNRCAECKGLKKLSFAYIKSEIEKDGSTLLSTEYKNAQTKLDIQCPNNHIYSLKWNHIKSGHRCHICFTDKHTGKNHSRYNPDRTRRRRSHLLSFNLKNINILSDDPNFNNYLEEKTKNTKNMYDVDHIFPRTAFIDNNLDLIYDIKIIKEICNSRDNLRIINNKENKSKSSKYNQQEFLNWFNQKLESV